VSVEALVVEALERVVRLAISIGVARDRARAILDAEYDAASLAADRIVDAEEDAKFPP
jgi:hypothetical protein